MSNLEKYFYIISEKIALENIANLLKYHFLEYSICYPSPYQCFTGNSLILYETFSNKCYKNHYTE